MAANMATVTGLICKADGTPVAGAHVRVTVKSTEQDQGGQVAGAAGVTSEQVEAFTDETGNFSIDLVAGTIVLLEIPDINLRKEVVVPAVGTTTDFTTLV